MPVTTDADGKQNVSHHKGIWFDRALSSSGSESTAGRAPTCTNKHGEWPAPSSGLMFALASEPVCIFY